MKHFFFFLCVYLKEIEGFQNGALRRTRWQNLGLFCLLQTFLMNKMSGVKGFFFWGGRASSLLESLFVDGKNEKVLVVALVAEKKKPTRFKLLLLWEKEEGVV